MRMILLSYVYHNPAIIFLQTEITKVNENGAYARLLEYDDMEGYLLSTEVTKKRVKLVNKYMKVGK